MRIPPIIRFMLVVATTMLPVAPSLAQDITPTESRIYVSPKGTAVNDGSMAKPLDIATAFAATSPAKPGDTILLQPGVYEGTLKDIQRVPFELAVSGTADKPIRVMPASGNVHLNGTLNVNGSHVWVVGLEIGDLTWDLEEKTRKNGPTVATGAGTGVKLINCNLFGGWCGVNSNAASSDAEFYGLLVHDFGNWGHKYAGGSSFYTQNRSDKGTKTISNCVAYRSAALNMAPHGQNGAVGGFTITRNILFLPGAVMPTTPAYENLFVNTGAVMDRIRVIGNVLYYSGQGKANKANARMSNLRKPTLNKSAVFQDNYVMGGPTGLRVSRWEDFRATGNTLWSQRVAVEISSAPTGDGIKPQEEKPDLTKYTLGGNTYYLPQNAKAFLYSDHEHTPAQDGELLTFADWQKLGLDKDSNVLPTKDGRPTGTKTFVFPNQYQANRAHVAIFNWNGLSEVEVDLTPALNKGVKFTVYNVLDIKQTLGQAKPVLTATFDGNGVKFPLRKDAGSPDMDAFLILPIR